MLTILKPPVAMLPPQVTTRGAGSSNNGHAAQRSAGPPLGGPRPDPTDPHLVTFFLTAPFKPAASLVGDFNGWDLRANPMESDGQGLFWTTVRLAGPSHYRFAITMDGGGKQVTVADPYAREVRWDPAGPKAFYRRRARFAWRHDGMAASRTPRPCYLRAVRARLCGREAQPPGPLRHVCRGAGEARSPRGPRRERDRADAGQRVPGDSSWGYNPIFYTAPKSIYGRPTTSRRWSMPRTAAASR